MLGCPLVLCCSWRRCRSPQSPLAAWQGLQPLVPFWSQKKSSFFQRFRFLRLRHEICMVLGLVENRPVPAPSPAAYYGRFRLTHARARSASIVEWVRALPLWPLWAWGGSVMVSWEEGWVCGMYVGGCVLPAVVPRPCVPRRCPFHMHAAR